MKLRPNFLGPLEGFGIPQVVDREMVAQIGVSLRADIGLVKYPGRIYLINIYQDTREIIVTGHKVIPMVEWLAILNEEDGQSFNGRNFTV